MHQILCVFLLIFASSIAMARSTNDWEQVPADQAPRVWKVVIEALRQTSYSDCRYEDSIKPKDCPRCPSYSADRLNNGKGVVWNLGGYDEQLPGRWKIFRRRDGQPVLRISGFEDAQVAVNGFVAGFRSEVLITTDSSGLRISKFDGRSFKITRVNTGSLAYPEFTIAEVPTFNMSCHARPFAPRK